MDKGAFEKQLSFAIPPQDTPLDKLNATQLECIPADIRCNMPGHLISLDGYKPFAVAKHVKMPSICYEMCYHEKNRKRCKSFSHTRRERRCAFYEFHVADGAIQKRLTGSRFWDAACWTCGVSRDPPW
ncbi:hypothetical protein BGZ63DRAFT_424989 [Mariannaea sp. PMI_226]|nr:hypothetical protein BGZ63DRAFT_424989 [Mariannaea sp. PMI_226]